MKPSICTPATLLIRHAESDANVGAATDSPASIRLTARGHQQAADLAARFDHAPGLIVVSPYLRTQQTAAPLIARFPAARVEEWPVHEFTYLNPKLYAGTTEAQRAVFADEYWRRCDPHWNDGGGAESFADFIHRVDALLERLANRRRTSTAVFTHGYFIKALQLRMTKPFADATDELMAEFRDSWKPTVVENTRIFLLGKPRERSRRAGCLRLICAAARTATCQASTGRQISAAGRLP